MTTLSIHVLDTTKGTPAPALGIHLSRWTGEGWERVKYGVTDDDGRFDFGVVEGGRHRIGFETGSYGNEFYPFVHVVFVVDESRPHYHVPLLLSEFGYTTYRGS